MWFKLDPNRLQTSWWFGINFRLGLSGILSYLLCLSAATSLDRKLDMAAQIGPQPAQVDFEETLASLESLPLFMKSLPSEDSDDIALQALQSLAHDGTPDGASTPYFCSASLTAPKKSLRTSRSRGASTSRGSATEKPSVFIPRGLTRNRQTLSSKKSSIAIALLAIWS